jgi:hypothetical protein
MQGILQCGKNPFSLVTPEKAFAGQFQMHRWTSPSGFQVEGGAVRGAQGFMVHAACGMEGKESMREI